MPQVLTAETMPDSIDEIIRYMDFLEPSQEYFKRQEDSRGGCSGTRGKVRKMAKKDPNHPAVAHWTKTKNWKPPDEKTLDEIIKVLKSIITVKDVDVNVDVDVALPYMDKLEPKKNYCFDLQKDSQTSESLPNITLTHDHQHPKMPQVLTAEAMPDSIDEIIRYMDFLEPSQEYFKRQEDSRGGCSGTRGKVRKMAKKDPNHPAVAHWTKTKNWKPPDEKTLDEIIKVLKSIITVKDVDVKVDVEDALPDSIDGIIRYMDKLEPKKNYFDRQKDLKGRCSRTRGKLIKWAKMNPNDPAVAHYTETKEWAPPNQDVLDDMVALLKTLIIGR